MKTQSAARRAPFLEPILHSLQSLSVRPARTTGGTLARRYRRIRLREESRSLCRRWHASRFAALPRSGETGITAPSQALPAHAVKGFCTSALVGESDAASATGNKGRKDPAGEIAAVEADREQANRIPQNSAVKSASARCCHYGLCAASSADRFCPIHIYINMLICFYAYHDRHSGRAI